LMVYQSFLVASLGEAYLLASRTQDASVTALRGLELARTHKERGNQAWILRLLGEIASRPEHSETDQAEGYCHQALALAEELRMRPLQAHCRLGLGTLYRKAGDREKAQTELSAAVELYRAMDMHLWLPEAEVELAGIG
jgi:tetratricopeptide (TPR) repeat protein